MSHKTISDSSYVHSELLVDTQWLEDHLPDNKLGVIEIDYNGSAN